MKTDPKASEKKYNKQLKKVSLALGKCDYVRFADGEPVHVVDYVGYNCNGHLFARLIGEAGLYTFDLRLFQFFVDKAGVTVKDVETGKTYARFI